MILLCDTPNLLQFSVDAVVLCTRFGRVADLLASYDLPRFFYIQSE
jgi:hypothetical protein